MADRLNLTRGAILSGRVPRGQYTVSVADERTRCRNWWDYEAPSPDDLSKSEIIDDDGVQVDADGIYTCADETACSAAIRAKESAK